jgi:hypothetical protein
MENNTSVSVNSSKTTPKDFFLWLLAIIALYGSITSFITLLFEYINYSFPDALAGYGDPYGGAVRYSMAALIVLVPTMLGLLRLIRGTIVKEAGKAMIWVRRWALGLTLFIATVTILIDLVTLINTFLGGEITIRFGLKVLVVLLVALGVFLHFLADMRGYWIKNIKRSVSVAIGVGVLTVTTIVAGFFIIGSPAHMRDLRYDDQKVSDLQNIQYQVVNYYQQKRILPKMLTDLNDPLTNFIVPTDPQPASSYRYEQTATLSFKLCATFNAPTPDTKGRGGYGGGTSYPMPAGIDGVTETWKHATGETCFDRTIDPAKYPPLNATSGKPFMGL